MNILGRSLVIYICVKRGRERDKRRGRRGIPTRFKRKRRRQHDSICMRSINRPYEKFCFVFGILLILIPKTIFKGVAPTIHVSFLLCVLDRLDAFNSNGCVQISCRCLLPTRIFKCSFPDSLLLLHNPLQILQKCKSADVCRAAGNVKKNRSVPK